MVSNRVSSWQTYAYLQNDHACSSWQTYAYLQMAMRVALGRHTRISRMAMRVALGRHTRISRMAIRVSFGDPNTRSYRQSIRHTRSYKMTHAQLYVCPYKYVNINVLSNQILFTIAISCNCEAYKMSHVTTIAWLPLYHFQQHTLTV